MFDIKLIRENLQGVSEALAAKNTKVDLEQILKLDQRRRELLIELDDLRSQKNIASDEIGLMVKEKKDPKPKIASMKFIAEKIDQLDPQLREVEEEQYLALLGIPNLAHESVPVGGVDKNETIRQWGEPRTFTFKPKTHVELGQDLDIIDFKRAAKISGSHFILFKNQGAALQRALINFMIDVHTREHGYKEILPPVLVNEASMIGTGQLPKMAEDMYKLRDDDLYLIPTAEVPVTNIHRDEFIGAKDLPAQYVAYSPCFRREAGSYGKDTKGLIRVHQFDKVEMVRFVKPESSYEQLECLVNNAEKIFQLLKLPYRVLLLATGDLSFAAAKCYDIEAYASGMDKWLEVSSCSNFEAFQARRANIRFKDETSKKAKYVHTLNGSGVALARTVVAILENYQNEQGEIDIPEILQPYMGGRKVISKST